MRIIELKPLIASNNKCCEKLKLDSYVVTCKKCGGQYVANKFVNSKFVMEGEACDYKEKKQNYKQWVYIKV